MMQDSDDTLDESSDEGGRFGITEEYLEYLQQPQQEPQSIKQQCINPILMQVLNTVIYPVSSTMFQIQIVPVSQETNKVCVNEIFPNDQDPCNLLLLQYIGKFERLLRVEFESELHSSLRDNKSKLNRAVPITTFVNTEVHKIQFEFKFNAEEEFENELLVGLFSLEYDVTKDEKGRIVREKKIDLGSMRLGLVTNSSKNNGGSTRVLTIMLAKPNPEALDPVRNICALKRLMRMTTFCREWEGLYMKNICKEMLHQLLLERPANEEEQRGIPTSYEDIPRPTSISEMLWTTLTDHYNVSQLNAISHVVHAMDKETSVANVTLIQGPPGTGKTSTIEGLVSAILHRDTGNVDVKKRILICAPSNAAIDVILTRLKLNGVFDGCPKEKALANDQNIRREIKLVRLGEALEEASEYVKEMELRIQANRVIELTPNYYHLKYKHQTNEMKYSEFRKELNALRDQHSSRILQNAEVVGGTLSSTANGQLKRTNISFDTVIIDEAAQATEPSALLPLVFGCKHLILIGDPCQLAPFVKTQDKEVAKELAISLFERLQKNNHDFILLDTQYRMHPAIREFPSKKWYQGKLIDAPEILQEMTEGFGKCCVTSSLLSKLNIRPTLFFHVVGTEATLENSSSLINEEECEQIKSFLQRILPYLKERLSIGIITFYAGQLEQLKQVCEDLLTTTKCLEFNTVDAFQGREKDIIILSCVRSNTTGDIGFLNLHKRLNVAITRSKKALIVFGDILTLGRHDDLLRKDSMWYDFIRSFWEKECLYLMKDNVWINPPFIKGSTSLNDIFM